MANAVSNREIQSQELMNKCLVSQDDHCIPRGHRSSWIVLHNLKLFKHAENEDGNIGGIFVIRVLRCTQK